MSQKEIGCCGIYCRTCHIFIDGMCSGCKAGYENTDITKTKCKIKTCCFYTKKFETCADCKDYTSCTLIQDFYEREGYKSRDYKEAIDNIRENGYDDFLCLMRKQKTGY